MSKEEAFWFEDGNIWAEKALAGRPSIYGLCRDLTGLLDYSGSLRIKAIRTIKNRRKRKLPILKYFPYVRRVPFTGSHNILKSEELLPHFIDEATGGECPMVVILYRRCACCMLCLHPSNCSSGEHCCFVCHDPCANELNIKEIELNSGSKP